MSKKPKAESAKNDDSSQFNFGKNSATKRRALRTQSEIYQQMDVLKRLTEELEVAAKVMKNHDIASVTMDGATKFQRGVDSIAEYVGNLRSSIGKITLGVPAGKAKR